MSKVKWKVHQSKAYEGQYFVISDLQPNIDWGKDIATINCFFNKALARRVCRLLNREEKERKDV
jgi:hypothetical protein